MRPYKLRLRYNSMIVNPVKFQTILLDKSNSDSYLNVQKIWKPLKKLLIVGMVYLVTVLFVIWKAFHKNLLDVCYSSAFCLL